ncbi:hypothetical protein [Paenibacillus lautus]|uniref:hypothetical protein n=1 Tax=Paenibacillus lautus TaxID=1401 RepID=UPI003D2906D6
MSNLNFELYLEKIGFISEDFQTEVIHLKSYYLPSVYLTNKIIDDLHKQIILTKGDWLNFDCNVIGENYYINLNLIFHSLELSEYDNEMIDRVMEKIDLVIQGLIQSEAPSIIANNLEMLDSIIAEDGIIIKVREEGGWGVEEELINTLNENAIQFKTIRKQQSRFDGGASGGFEEVLLFIGASAASGITWDMLKGVLTSRFSGDVEKIKATLIDSYKFKRFRKAIAERIVEDYKDLVLIEFYKQQNEMIFEFKIYGIIGKSITVICDDEYQIQELNVERK